MTVEKGSKNCRVVFFLSCGNQRKRRLCEIFNYKATLLKLASTVQHVRQPNCEGRERNAKISLSRCAKEGTLIGRDALPGMLDWSED